MSARNFPLPRTEDDDPRFNYGLIFDVALALAAAGYPAVVGVDHVELGQALFKFIYAAEDVPAAVVTAAKDAYTGHGARLLDEDQPLAARGHGRDNDQADGYRVEAQRAELHLDLADELLADLAARSVVTR
jgi:hypothetical protein